MTFTILLYHGVDSGETWLRQMDGTDREYVLSRARFEDHIACLSKAGVPVASLDDCVLGTRSQAGGPAPVVLTFDDGDASCYATAAPVLERHGFRGEFFVVSQWIGRPGFVSREQLRELIARGHRVHAHSRTHPVLPALESAGIDEEVAGSKSEIEALTGAPVAYFSIPGGAYDSRVVDAARRAGYRRVLCSIEGYNESDDSAFLLKRFTPRSHTSVAFVKSVCLNHPYTRRRLALKRFALSSARRVLGDGYGRMRNAVMSRRT